MNALTRRGVIAGAFGALGACASMRDPVPGVLQIGGVYNVTLTRVWSDFTPERARNMRLLSLNGPALDRLYLAALKEDEGLSRRVSAGDGAQALSPELAAGFVVRSVASLGYAAPEIFDSVPFPFGGVDGWRLNLRTQTGDDLKIAAQARLAPHAGRLCIMLHIAARAHYYDATRADAEAVMESARFR